MMTSASDVAVAGSVTFKPADAAFSTEAEPSRRPDPDVDARVPQIEGVSVPLRPVPDNRHPTGGY